MTGLLAAVDVGTGSARAGLFRVDGTMVARAEQPIETFRVSHVMAAQDSDQIWQACRTALGAARREAGVAPDAVVALAFDATCSLTFRSPDGAPLGILPDEAARWDTILWLDHRAAKEAAEISAGGHPALAHLGGTMSPELALPKLLWVKRRMPGTWVRAGLIFDLADFLTWRATGTTARSLSTLTCKWCYLGPAGWPMDLLAAVGLADVPERAGITAPPVPLGGMIGRLSEAAAAELGLPPGIPVAPGQIDAYAGALGMLGEDRPGDLALIAGTSTCVLAVEQAPRFIRSAWGPFADVIFPGTFAIEVGQSVSGALLDRLLSTPGGGPPGAELRTRVVARLAKLRAATPDLAPGLQILPDFLGNRAPLAAPAARGTITGLDLGGDFDSLCRLYWRGAVALAIGLREMLAHLAAHGIEAERLLLAGGHARDEMLIGLYADATGLPVVVPRGDSVLLGTAIAAATAAKLFPNTRAAAAAMRSAGPVRAPDPAAVAGWVARDARAFALMRRHRAELEALLSPPE